MFERASPRDSTPAWGVSALLLAVSDHLTARFATVTVRGELSGVSRAASGHCYFALKDADGGSGLLRCAMFRRAVALLESPPADGQKVEVRGRLSLYEPRSELQLVVESLSRLGAGSLYEEFLRLRARLAAQGLFDPARRRPLPAVPRVVGVITSPDAAAWRDVRITLQRRAPHLRVVLFPSLVQGAQAPGELVAALVRAAQQGPRLGVELLLLVRGGGSLEDLWAFNDERVVRAVASSPLPVVCGVGHETDVTLCDLAADLRAPTPTAAAELASPPRDDLLAALQALQTRLQRAAQRSLDRQAQRLDLLAQRAGRPALRLAGQGHRLDGLARRLTQALHTRLGRAAVPLDLLDQRRAAALSRLLERRADALSAFEQRLTSVHPQQVLSRGFAWLQAPDGQPLTRVRQLAPGQPVRAVLADGAVDADVRAVHPTATPPPG
jgi:exodeoxyribonuclease VII large subunit